MADEPAFGVWPICPPGVTGADRQLLWRAARGGYLRTVRRGWHGATGRYQDVGRWRALSLTALTAGVCAALWYVLVAHRVAWLVLPAFLLPLLLFPLGANSVRAWVRRWSAPGRAARRLGGRYLEAEEFDEPVRELLERAAAAADQVAGSAALRQGALHVADAEPLVRAHWELAELARRTQRALRVAERLPRTTDEAIAASLGSLRADLDAGERQLTAEVEAVERYAAAVLAVDAVLAAQDRADRLRRDRSRLAELADELGETFAPPTDAAFARVGADLVRLLAERTAAARSGDPAADVRGERDHG